MEILLQPARPTFLNPSDSEKSGRVYMSIDGVLFAKTGSSKLTCTLVPMVEKYNSPLCYLRACMLLTRMNIQILTGAKVEKVEKWC